MEQTQIKTLDDVFLNEMQTDFGFTPVVSKAVLERAKSIFKSGQFDTTTVNVGQIRILAISSKEKSGKPLKQCKLVPITLTVDNGEDDNEIHNHNISSWRQAVICRIAEEAYDQETLLTEDDISTVLRCSLRTVKRDIKHLKEQDIFVPIRGDIIGTGRGQSHKVKIAEWYLKGATYTEIRNRMCHSFQAIKRYIETLGRVVICIKNEFSLNMTSRVVGITERLAKEYVDLYNHYNTEEYSEKFESILKEIKIPEELKVVKKRGVTKW
jgi:hypothetical protein